MKKLLEDKTIGGYVVYFNEKQKSNIVDLVMYDYISYDKSEHMNCVFQVHKNQAGELEYFNMTYCEYYNYYTISTIEDIIDEIKANDDIKALVLKTLK